MNNQPEPTTITASQVEQLAMANLLKRAADGAKLSDAEWQRIDDYHSREAAAPMDDLIADLRQKLTDAGKRPSKALVNTVRDLALRDVSQHIWPDAAAAAKDLGVSLQTVRNWCGELGIESNRVAISRSELYAALWRRAEAELAARPSGAGQSAAAQKEQELRNEQRQLALDVKRGRLLAEAMDATRDGIARAIAIIRNELPKSLAAHLASGATDEDRLAAEGRYLRTIRQFLPEICQQLTQQCQDGIGQGDQSQETKGGKQ